MSPRCRKAKCQVGAGVVPASDVWLGLQGIGGLLGRRPTAGSHQKACFVFHLTVVSLLERIGKGERKPFHSEAQLLEYLLMERPARDNKRARRAASKEA